MQSTLLVLAAICGPAVYAQQRAWFHSSDDCDTDWDWTKYGDSYDMGNTTCTAGMHGVEQLWLEAYKGEGESQDYCLWIYGPDVCPGKNPTKLPYTVTSEFQSLSRARLHLARADELCRGSEGGL